jgi:hypothetical protein
VNRADVIQLVTDSLYPSYRSERARLDHIDLWYRWDQEDIRIPRGATPELRALSDLAKTPWLGLVVSTVAQAMAVDGYRSPEGGDNKAPWRTWFANGMPQRQNALHRAALAYGYSFAKVLPGVNMRGEAMASIRGVDPRQMFAVFQDPANDEFPMYTLEIDGKLAYFTDDQQVWTLGFEDGKWQYITDQFHRVGVCPVVQYSNQLDLRGGTAGEVEPFIGVAARINKTSYDRLLTQHFNSWKVRTIAGLAEPDSEEEANRKKIQLRQDDMLVAEDPDTKFGSLPESPLNGFIDAHESDIDSLAAVSQTPRFAFGKLVNLSAEALAAARAPLSQKIGERQQAFGAKHASVLRLAAHIQGDEESADDVMAEVTWQDLEIRSMAQAVDALGKASTMLGIPPKALWSRIPGVTKSDVDDWSDTGKYPPAPTLPAPVAESALPTD